MVVAVTTDGVCEVEQFLAALPARAKAQFKSRFEHYCAVGYLRNPDQMRKLQCDEDKPPVHEMKIPDGPGYRLFGIVEDNLFVATHGAKKPKESTLKKHAKRARDAYRKGRETSEGRDRP
jgi:putative component of toxin-antitoxin plasmid stabilization module